MGTTTRVPASLGTEGCRLVGGLGTGDAAGRGTGHLRPNGQWADVGQPRGSGAEPGRARGHVLILGGCRGRVGGPSLRDGASWTCTWLTWRPLAVGAATWVKPLGAQAGAWGWGCELGARGPEVEAGSCAGRG